MKTKQMALFLVLLLTCVLPCVAQDDAAEDAGQETFRGRWHVQLMDGHPGPGDGTMHLTFEQNTVMLDLAGGDEEPWSYLVDEDAGTLTLYDRFADGDEGVEGGFTLRYRLAQGVLELVPQGSAFGGDQSLELTRNAEGTERHQTLREESSDQPNPAQLMQSLTQMRGLHQGGVTYAASNGDKMPMSVGDLVVGDFVTPQYTLTPWSEQTVPDGFEDWADARKVAWVNTHTGYVYFDAGHQVDFDADRIVFLSLPPSEDSEVVGLIFGDNHGETLDYEEADARVQAQTGHTIAQWMQTISPGTGEMILLENEQDEQDE